MELVKELPEIFEEFAEQRQRSFLVMKEVKDKGIPVVGAYCTYFPQEIAMAMGAVTVGLCSTSDETIPIAEKDLPKNLCPMVKASYGFAVSDKCPFFYFSDVVVGETTCDGKKKMYAIGLAIAGLIPLIRLTEVLDLESTRSPEDNLIVVIVKKGDKMAGLVIDELIGQQEIVIKSLGKYIKQCKFISGATILGDGEVALILDANALL